MKATRKLAVIKSALGAAALLTAVSASAQANWGGAQGTNLGQISQNVAGSLGGVASGFEAFLYLLGIVFVVMCVLAAWKYKKSDGRDSSMGHIVTYLVLAVACMAAPTLLASMGVTIFGNTATTKVSAPPVIR